MTEFRIITPLASQWARLDCTMNAVSPSKQWFGFLRIPEGKSGKFEIKHRVYPAGSMFRTASARTAIFGKHECVKVVIDGPVIVHELRESGGVWMTDLPIEQAQIDPALEPMRGNVLVGGLGLGYAAQTLALKPSVDQVTVIERSPEVIDLVAEHLRGGKTKKRNKIRVIEADLHVWLRENPQLRFDWAFYDIWAPDGERVLFDHVLPLRELSRGIVPDENVRCWNEDVMRGQLFVQLVSRLQMLQHPEVFGESGLSLDKLCELPAGKDAKMLRSFAMCVPFFQAFRDGRFTLAEANERARVYVENYGIPGRVTL